MKQFIAKLMARLSKWFSTEEPRIVFLKEAKWTQEDAEDLREFFKTDLGKNLIAILNVDVAFAQAWAISPNQMDMQYKSGFAHGKQRMIDRLHELSFVAPPVVDGLKFSDQEVDSMLNRMAKGKRRDISYGLS